MLSKKNLEDYSWETTENSKGKVVDLMVYKGPLYKWEKNQSEMKRIITKLAILTIISVVAYISSLWNYSSIARIWYILIPYSLIFIFLAFQISSIYGLITHKENFKRKEKEKMVDRLKTIGFVERIFSIYCLLASILYSVKSYQNFTIWDYYFLSMIVILVIVSFLFYKTLKNLIPIEINK